MVLALRLAFWLALGLALVMALLPNPPELAPETPDKFQHILAFATLTALAAAAWPATSWMKIGIGLALFGALIEVLQTIPTLHRDGDVWDWAADMAAVAVVLLILAAMRRVRSGPR